MLWSSLIHKNRYESLTIVSDSDFSDNQSSISKHSENQPPKSDKKNTFSQQTNNTIYTQHQTVTRNET